MNPTRSLIQPLLLAAFCLFAPSLFAADIRGKITRLHNPDPRDNALVRYLHVEGKIAHDTQHDNARVRVPEQARIFKLEEGKKVAAKISDLKQGQVVEITFTGPVAESYPVQASAGEIVILRDTDEAQPPRVDSRGKITNIAPNNRADIIGTITIEGRREADTFYNAAIARILPSTRILKQQDGKRVEAKFTDLKMGHRVELAYAGPVTRSLPPQGSAATIVILPDEKEEPDEVPLVKEGLEVALDGNLRGGMMGIGGESTGWVLNYESNHGRRSIQVDVSGVKQGAPRNGAVLIKGKVILKNYVERGPTLILKATHIEVVSAPPQRRQLP